MFPLLLLFLLATTPDSPQEIPTLTGRIVDLADLIPADRERALSDFLATHEDSTGNQIAVLTVPSLAGAVLEEYSIEVARTWGLGTADQDNGVLVLVAFEERRMRIEVGEGLESVITDLQAGRVLDNLMRPRFREGDYAAGIESAVFALVGLIEGTTVLEDEGGLSLVIRLMGLFFLLIPGLIVVNFVVQAGWLRWFGFFFLSPFIAVAGFLLTGSGGGIAIILGIYAVGYVFAASHPAVRKARKAVASGKAASVGPFTIGGGSSGGSGGSGSSFSGGGGSFGGGGASGSW